eukprot:gnl/TRDRNA2_/TRDRNA2_175135_c0_seq5.p1 gnl/TRDRNA2_/TRDRNA2_175135_c0~~gnl/TRDRNA2_/TRDRNA2_175135_c0_seq5.p1  ORF type:complete len:464 (+),score=68.36 gnl/TRDRNA2_/TRDRNA2_175135_c0_seq5:124-1515(+)
MAASHVAKACAVIAVLASTELFVFVSSNRDSGSTLRGAMEVETTASTNQPGEQKSTSAVHTSPTDFVEKMGSLLFEGLTLSLTVCIILKEASLNWPSSSKWKVCTQVAVFLVTLLLQVQLFSSNVYSRSASNGNVEAERTPRTNQAGDRTSTGTHALHVSSTNMFFWARSAVTETFVMLACCGTLIISNLVNPPSTKSEGETAAPLTRRCNKARTRYCESCGGQDPGGARDEWGRFYCDYCWRFWERNASDEMWYKHMDKIIRDRKFASTRLCGQFDDLDVAQPKLVLPQQATPVGAKADPSPDPWCNDPKPADAEALIEYLHHIEISMDIVHEECLGVTKGSENATIPASPPTPEPALELVKPGIATTPTSLGIAEMEFVARRRRRTPPPLPSRRRRLEQSWLQHSLASIENEFAPKHDPLPAAASSQPPSGHNMSNENRYFDFDSLDKVYESHMCKVKQQV